VGIYVGLMSGTSLDGVDAAVVRLEGEGERPEWELLSYRSTPYGRTFRERLRRACESGSPRRLSALDFELGRRFGDAVREAIEERGIAPGAVEAIGSAGQTVWHAPPGRDGPRGHTLQLGEAAVIAEETGCPVVSDFRVRDVAAGGHGAPLTGYVDALLFRAPDRGRAVLNLGGIGNLTLLPPAGDGREPMAFDTGPGVVLLDAAVHRLTGGRRAYDREGEMASRGSVLPDELREWLADPFFCEPPPRSTGRERFSPERVEAWIERRSEESAGDLLATLAEVTARSVADSLERAPVRPGTVYVAGGGARNAELVRRIGRRVDPVRIRPLSELGLDADAREAFSFAVLARQHLLGFPAGAPWATGARGPRVLGKRTPA